MFFLEVIISDLLAIITTLYEGSNPYGENINYDPEFDIVKNEIGKLGNLDFDLIETTSLKLLKEKSKDLRLLSFLSMVFLKKENWEGFCDVFDGIGVLFELNYDAIFPDRERAKQMALKWLSEDRYSDLIASKKPTEAHYDHIVRLITGLTKMKPVLEKKFPDGSPFPSNILKHAELWEKSCKPKGATPSPSPLTQTAPGAAAVSSNTVSATEIGNSGGSAEPMDTTKQAQAIIRKAAQFLIEKEPLKPTGFRIMRSLRWDLLEKAPPSEGGKTQLSPPQPQQRTYFQNIVGQKEWKTAIEKAESTFAAGAHHLWLDLQRIIACSCKEIGNEYVLIGNAVTLETAHLLQRIPELTGMSFSDGSLFCDGATKDWINTEVKAALSGSSGTITSGKAGHSDTVVEEIRKTNELTAAGKVEDALDLLQHAIKSSSIGKDNFRRSIAMGDLLLKAKQPDLAVSVLEALAQKIELRDLVTWDQDLVVEAWSVLVLAYKAAKVQKQPNVVAQIHEKQYAIISKISIVDPVKALILNK